VDIDATTPADAGSTGTPDTPLGESRWPPSIAVLAFVIANVSVRIWLPTDRAISLPWLLPAVEVVLLGVLVLMDPSGDDRRSARLRPLAIGLVGLLLTAALWSTIILVDHLVAGDKQTNDGARLLTSGGLVWAGNILAFSLLYWILDSGGPRARYRGDRPYRDLAFVQIQQPELAPPGWRTVFWDYLFLGFCTSTAFSPTDVLPLARWAKLAMAIQSVVSLAVVGLIIARAVNVFS